MLIVCGGSRFSLLFRSVLTINLVNSLILTDDEFEVTEQEELGLVQVTFKNPLSDKALLLMDSRVLEYIPLKNSMISVDYNKGVITFMMANLQFFAHKKGVGSTRTDFL